MQNSEKNIGKCLVVSNIMFTFALRKFNQLKLDYMFLRFSKGQFDHNKIRKFRKCVFLGDSVVMEYGDNIVGVAKLHEETDKCFDYDVIVANKCELGGEKIARFIKDMIGKSNKFTNNPSTKRRKYYVEFVESEFLPLRAEIKFSKI